MFNLHLSTQPAPTPYASSAKISFVQDDVTLHIPGPEPIRALQKAARQFSPFAGNAVNFAGVWSPLYIRVFLVALDKHDMTVTLNGAELPQLVQHHLTAIDFCQCLVNATPQDISPEILATQVANYLEELAPEAVSAKHIIGEALVEFGWQGIYEVGRGSERPPVLLELDYNPTGNLDAPVDLALVGKGITFDSGGYSIKSSEGMLDMKCDMGGAATVSAALALAIMEGSKKRIKLYLCCAENLISGHAYKLGDVITYKNGTTVEIVNTDAEGRLVLADGLMAASEDNPTVIVDAATLTGAAVMALGTDYNAVFTQTDSLADLLTSLGETHAEPFWRLPLAPFHSDNCPSPFAETANSRPQKGGGAGGASNAAGFLARFVEPGIPWVHIDLSGAYHRNATATKPAGSSGMGVIAIAEFIKQVDL
jgi:PepB aminopeptidase